jgi:hypothetical protein
MRPKSLLGRRPASRCDAILPESADLPRRREIETMHRRGLLAALTVIVVMATGLTEARAGQYQRFHNQVWFGITQTWSSSHCIGRPVDPICAVETAIACLARAQAALCRRVGVKDLPRPLWRPRANRYRLLSIRWIDEGDIAGIYRSFRYRTPELWERIPDDLQIRMDDVQIAVEQDICASYHEEGHRCTAPSWLFDYYVRRRGDEWYVITWRQRELKP